MSFRERVAFRNLSVRTPERPTTQESSPFRRMLSTRIGSLNSAPDTIWPSARGTPESETIEVPIGGIAAYLTLWNRSNEKEGLATAPARYGTGPAYRLPACNLALISPSINFISRVPETALLFHIVDLLVVTCSICKNSDCKF